MQDDNHNGAAPGHADDKGSANLARRKAILKGLGKTAAVAGAAVPLTTLAGARLRMVENGRSMHCSDSGQGSVLMSGAVGNIPLCSGETSSFYGKYTRVDTTAPGVDPTADEWPNAAVKPVTKDHWKRWPNNGTNAYVIGKNGNQYTPAATFAAVFGGGSSTLLGTLLLTMPSSAEAQWLTALLNAQKKFPASWPHSTAEIFSQYSGSNAARALALYIKINKRA